MHKKLLPIGVIALILLTGVGCKPITKNQFIGNCAKKGEVDNHINMTNGKPNPSGKECCNGLKAIGEKTDEELIQKGGCALISGGQSICAPCGNGICDTEYEDKCNCYKDCK